MFTKLFYSVAVLATVTSCTKHVATETVHPNESSIIGFRNLSDRVMPTKSKENTDVKYKVYSEYTTASEAPQGGWYIENMTVTPVASGNYDTPAESHIWPTYDLDFYAFAPEDSANYTIVKTDPTTTSKGSLSATYTVNKNASEDFWVAEPKTNMKKTSSGGVVPFVFNHMLAKVTITVTGDADFVPSWTGKASLSGTKLNRGTVDIKSANPKIVTDGEIATSINYEGEDTKEAVFYIIPQDIVDFVVKVDGVSVTKNSKKTPLGDLSHTMGATESSITKFEAGKSYNLHFNVVEEDNKIRFNATVENWEAEHGVTLPS